MSLDWRTSGDAGDLRDDILGSIPLGSALDDARRSLTDAGFWMVETPVTPPIDDEADPAPQGAERVLVVKLPVVDSGFTSFWWVRFYFGSETLSEVDVTLRRVLP